MIRWLAVLLTLALGLIAGGAQAAKLALVIGNENYEHGNALTTPQRDARDFAYFLRQLGFETRLVLDADREQMHRAAWDLGRQLLPGDTAIFYYAGHALEADGENFLVGVDADLLRGGALILGRETLGLDKVLAALQGRAETTLLFIDASSENSFYRELYWGRHVLPPALSRVEVDTGMLIALSSLDPVYAPEPEGHNSPFTTALMKNIAEPGVEILQALSRVRREIELATHGRLSPWVGSSLLHDVYLGASPDTPVDN